jgi:hypothetical protein
MVSVLSFDRSNTSVIRRRPTESARSTTRCRPRTASGSGAEVVSKTVTSASRPVTAAARSGAER